MSVALLWTLVLMGTAIPGLWLAPRRWWGWLIGTLNEVLWGVYAVSIHSQALLVMAIVWFCLYARNTWVARERARLKP